ncbi:circumsporozoite protein-like [Schistocerca serialis cubense]|uniref:circumsporozoite protein-like n=1 Tax=Schistocerca serialis cubense TaxID=2023355 RepID=UPI00214F3114|nr:circumsporozoite protein-like [Schistocerca serialis cubense]
MEKPGTKTSDRTPPRGRPEGGGESSTSIGDGGDAAAAACGGVTSEAETSAGGGSSAAGGGGEGGVGGGVLRSAGAEAAAECRRVADCGRWQQRRLKPTRRRGAESDDACAVGAPGKRASRRSGAGSEGDCEMAWGHRQRWWTAQPVGLAEEPVEPAAAVETTAVAAGLGLAPHHWWKPAHPGSRKKAAEQLAGKKRRSENPDAGAGVGCGAGGRLCRRCGGQRADGLMVGRSPPESIRLSGRNLAPR